VVLPVRVPVLEKELVSRTDNAGFKIVAHLPKPDLIGGDAREELRHVGIARGAVVLHYRVGPHAARRIVGIVAGQSAQGVGACVEAG